MATVFSFPAAAAAGSIQTPLRRAPDGRPGRRGNGIVASRCARSPGASSEASA